MGLLNRRPLFFWLRPLPFLYLISIYTKDQWIVLVLGSAAVLGCGAIYRLMSRSPQVASWTQSIYDDAEAMHDFVEGLSPAKLALAIAISAGLGLFSGT